MVAIIHLFKMIRISQKQLWLYLAICCLLGVLLTYFIDGYLGTFDTLSFTLDGRRTQKVETFEWLRGDRSWADVVSWGKVAIFTYTIGNHQFSPSSFDIDVSLWHDGKEISKLVAQTMSIAPFGTARVKWSIDTQELEPAPPAKETHYDYSIKILTGDITREIDLSIGEPRKNDEVAIRNLFEPAITPPGLSGSDMPFHPE